MDNAWAPPTWPGYLYAQDEGSIPSTTTEQQHANPTGGCFWAMRRRGVQGLRVRQGDVFKMATIKSQPSTFIKVLDECTSQKFTMDTT